MRECGMRECVNAEFVNAEFGIWNLEFGFGGLNQPLIDAVALRLTGIARSPTAVIQVSADLQYAFRTRHYGKGFASTDAINSFRPTSELL